MSSKDFDITVPLAESMIQSLRAFGYDLTTAIADLLDNSISADAKHIWVDFEWNGENSAITITDDGRGMTEEGLVHAMRLGSTSPLQERGPKDLGRFGLGLKTASFSQCRVLTVKAKSNRSEAVIRCWDLDYVTKKQEWRLLKQAREGSDLYFKRLHQLEHGTTVLWEVMDRLVRGMEVNSRKDHDWFLEQVDLVYRHIAMIFHRFLEQTKPVKIFVNDRPVVPWNPFLVKSPATQSLGVEELIIKGKKVSVHPYVLPHRSKINDDIYDLASGIKGWNASQGFYVYRNRRMLVDGDWLGLGFQKEEHYKLARIMIDLPNDLDDEWDIDVKKSKARPPAGIRADLKRIAKLTRERAVNIYRHRGKVISRKTSAEYVYPWKQLVRRGKTFYSINREHPLVKNMIHQSGEHRSELQALLKFLEETVPVTMISITNSENPDLHGKPFEFKPTKELLDVLQVMYQALIQTGSTSEEAILRLSVMEPFDQYPELLASYKEHLEVQQ
ncbi:ATP-binding protein [Brevibacillus choshinensis]|uniref:ATP-binding protein n=1 Tax=Brevibacillus choshinensis TaxID=54911 RepID=UPI002E229943|nr:ATP-binding protein [Brevibacillus choshinensis]